MRAQAAMVLLMACVPAADLVRSRLGTVDLTTITVQPQSWQVDVVPASDVAAIRRKPRHVVINAGYFDAADQPIGLLAAAGRTIHPLGDAGILSGIFAITATGSPTILRGRTPPIAARLAIQSGPLLVEPDGSMGIRSDGPARRRTVVVIQDGALRIVVTAPIGLRALAEHLVAGRATAVLNLDGGPSTALWARLDGSVVDDPNTVPVPWFLAWWQDGQP